MAGQGASWRGQISSGVVCQRCSMSQVVISGGSSPSMSAGAPGDDGSVGAASAFEGQDATVGLAVGTVALLMNMVAV